MSENFKYYGKHRERNKPVGQNNVGQTKDVVIRTRIDRRTYERAKQTKIPLSHLIREILNQYLNQIEIEGI